jgi:hypothetical protein
VDRVAEAVAVAEVAEAVEEEVVVVVAVTPAVAEEETPVVAVAKLVLAHTPRSRTLP